MVSETKDPESTQGTSDKMNKLLDKIIKDYGLKNNAHLARELGCSSATITNLRADRKHLTPHLILLIYDFTNYSIEEIRELAKEN